jgi:carboxylesterase
MNDYSFALPGSREKGALLIHGLTGAPAEMMFLAKRLNKRGFTVHTPQLAGHCGSVDALLRTTWSDWLQSVRDAYKKLAAQVDEVSVAGICVGGALGLALAAERPEVSRAAVYSMTFEYDGWNMHRWYRLAPLMRLAHVAPMLRTLRFQERHPYGIKDQRLRDRLEQSPESVIAGALPFMPLGALLEMYRLCRHVERLGPSISQPTLIAHAVEDDMSNVRNAYRLAKALNGPVDMMLLEDSFHMIHVDRERNRLADETARFFGAEFDAAASLPLKSAPRAASLVATSTAERA